jgi:SAM-dependent methyltransferase
MKVLDLGSGSGDVSFLAAEIVGASGRVVGVDRHAPTVAAASERARRRGFEQVTFLAADAGEPIEGAPFDALIGRFILMHQAKPAQALQSALVNLRPGGIVAFVESSMGVLMAGGHSFPHSKLYDRIVQWKCRVVAGSGADLDAGLRLRETFLGAGLPEPETRLDAVVAGGPDAPLYRYLAESVRSMLPRAEALGIDGFDAASVETLADRLRAEVTAAHGVLVNWPVVAAWTRIPGAS